MSPVAEQRVDRHPGRADAVFELVDEVLLIAALIRQEDDRRGRRGLIVRQIEEIPNLIKQPMVPLLDRNILADHHHPVRLHARRRLVRKLRDGLRRQPDILELARHDGGGFHIHRPFPRLGLDRVRGPAHQRGPRRRRQRVRPANQPRAGVVAEDEPHRLAVPPIQVLRLREVRVAPKRDARAGCRSG